MPFAGQIIRALDFPPTAWAEQQANEDNFGHADWQTGANVCGMSFMAPTSGRGTIFFHCRFGSIGSPATNANVSIHIRAGSTVGAGTTIPGGIPSEDDSLENPAPGVNTTTNRLGAATLRHLTGLTAGNTYNAVMVHQVVSGTATIFHRTMLWVPSP